jgi:hypothetical protein
MINSALTYVYYCFKQFFIVCKCTNLKFVCYEKYLVCFIILFWVHVKRMFDSIILLFKAWKTMFFGAVQSATIETNGSLIIKAYTKWSSDFENNFYHQTLPNRTSNSKQRPMFWQMQELLFSWIGIGNGQIVIYDNVNNTFWVFKFNLENIFNNPLRRATLNFQQGVYKVPIVFCC